MSQKRFISIKDLSTYLDIKVNTLYSWVSMKKISYVKIEGLVRFELKKIDNWLEEREVKPFC